MPTDAAPNGHNGRPEFASYLKGLRLRQGHMSRAELAQLTNGYCTERTIGNYERCVTSPRPGSPQLRALAEVFRIQPADLLRGERKGK